MMEDKAAQQQQQQQRAPMSPNSASGVTFRPKQARALPPVQPSAAERVATFKADFVNKPQTDAARQYLQQRFGVEAPARSPTAAEKTTIRGFGPGSVARGLNSNPATIIPKSIRLDPYATCPPELTDLELSKGLMHLVNAGLLHAKSDLTPALVGDHGPVRAGTMPLLRFQQQFSRPPPTTALEDSLLAAAQQPFKLDLLTPVVPPAARQPQQQSSLKPLTVGGSPSKQNPQQQMQADAAEVGAGAPAAGPPRGFDALMDTFSLHEFMIRFGKTITATPEFESYRRTYECIWDVIAMLIMQLEVGLGARDWGLVSRSRFEG
jgi:hypothetical protein